MGVINLINPPQGPRDQQRCDPAAARSRQGGDAGALPQERHLDNLEPLQV